MKRFWDKVDRTPGQGPRGDCWLWMASCKRDGYGQFKLDGRMRKAHRVAMILTHGHEPRGQALHSCHVRRCCNPAHLRDGTAVENMAERNAADRQCRKVSRADIRAIRSRYASRSVAQWQLGLEYGITQSQISNIVRRKQWRHIAEAEQ